MKRKQPTSTFKQKPLTPSVTFQPQTYQGLQRGINLLANAVRPTLGPVPRVVAIEPVGPGDKRPEMLDNAGLIARRLLQVPDRDADTGAMFLRHLLWRQHERVGDGTAITAVLFQEIYNRGVTYIQAGGNAIRMRQYLEQGMALVIEHLRSKATPLSGRQQIAHMALGLCQDPPIADALAEILETVSEHGAIEVRSGRMRHFERQYVIGTYYKGKPCSEWILAEQPNRRIDMHHVAILVSDISIQEPADLVPLMRLIDSEQIENLLLIAREVSEPAMAGLLAVRQAPRPCRIVAVKAPDAVTGQASMLDDIAVLTGARRFLSVAGDSLRTIRPDDLGHARRAWSDEEFFGIISGKGAPRALRSHLEKLRAAFEHAEDSQVRQKLRERIGKLLGGTAILSVGGISDIDIKVRKELTERTLAAVRTTIGKGVVPGGGIALLSCRNALCARAEQASDPDERMAYRILMRALEEPTRTVLWNAGYDPAQWMATIERSGPGYGLNVLNGEVVHMEQAGIIDSAGVLEAALHSAIASAALALTVDVLVHTRLPELSFEP